jgi:hypothetical protein
MMVNGKKIKGMEKEKKNAQVSMFIKESFVKEK